MNFFKTMLITLGVLVMAWSCTSPLDNVNTAPAGETVYGEGEGGLVLTLNPTAPSGSSRFTGNGYTLADVTLVTVQLTHEVTKAIKFASATASGGTVKVLFDRLPTGTWDLKANLYDNSTTPPDLLYWSFDKVQIKPRTTATKTLMAIPTGSLDGTFQELPALTAVAVTDGAAGTSGSIPATAPFQLFATLNPVNYPYPKVDWFSSDPKVASVDPFGVVTTYRPGTVTITAKAGMLVGEEVSGSYALTVLEPFIGDWRTGSPEGDRGVDSSELFWMIRPDNTWMHVNLGESGDDLAFRGTWTASDGNIIFKVEELLEAKTGVWSTNDDGEKDLFTGWYINYNGNLVMDYYSFMAPQGFRRFKHIPATTITPSGSFTPGATALAVNFTGATSDDNLLLGARANPEATFPIVAWGSSDPLVVQVDGNGKIEVTGPGTALVRAITIDGSVQATMPVTVSSGVAMAQLTSLDITPHTYNPNSPGTFDVNFLPASLKARVEYSSDGGITWNVSADSYSDPGMYPDNPLSFPAGKVLQVRVSPGIENDGRFFADSTKGRTLTVYTPVYLNGYYMPQIVSVASVNDPTGDRTFDVTYPLVDTFSTAFYTNNSGSMLSTNDIQLKIGTYTYWIYTGGTVSPNDLLIVRYKTSYENSNLVNQESSTGQFGVFPSASKLWKVSLNPDSTIDFFSAGSEVLKLNWMQASGWFAPLP